MAGPRQLILSQAKMWRLLKQALAQGALVRCLITNRATAEALAMAGARCGDADPTRAEAAALNIPIAGGPWQISPGFGSMWATQFVGTEVVRIDPATGDVLATIDIADRAFKLQPADGRMWVRAGLAYVAIDAATNAVVATLAKAEVGPAANRSWAVDGAMWICDGQRLHRYDPETVQPVALVELGIECGQVTATADLAVAWTYNEDDGQSGTAAAAFIDPVTNELLATVDLPVDAGGPVVLDEVVFFAGYGGSTAVVVDRATWAVTATPDLGRATGGSLIVSDGQRIFVPTDGNPGPKDILVVDASTFAVTDTIEPLGNNAVALLDDSLWTGDNDYSVMQRHDL